MSILYLKIKSVNDTIYDTRINISNDTRAYLWIDNENYKNGRLIYKGARAVCGFHFHMKDYDPSLLYPNSDKYKITFNCPTPYLYKNCNENSKKWGMGQGFIGYL